MKACIDHASAGYENTSLIKDKIAGLQQEVDFLYPKRFFSSKTEERVNHLLAVEQALDVVNKIEARFITGGHDLIPRGYGDRGHVYHNDDSLFD